jgi:Xaa-Pro aminopeptidase
MFSKEVYTSRREKLKSQVGNGLILLLANEQSPINYLDNTYPFRQDSNFLYFLGIDRSGLASFIYIDNNDEIIFGNDTSIEDIIWPDPL